MVKNSEIENEFNIFSDGFKLYKEVLPVHKSSDDAYWADVVQKFSDFREKYNCEFCNGYAQLLLKDLDRKGKEMRNDGTM